MKITPMSMRILQQYMEICQREIKKKHSKAWLLLSLLFLFPHSYSHHHTLPIFEYSKLKPMPHLSRTPVVQPSRRVSDLNMDISLQYHPPNKLHKTNRHMGLQVIKVFRILVINRRHLFLLVILDVIHRVLICARADMDTPAVATGSLVQVRPPSIVPLVALISSSLPPKAHHCNLFTAVTKINSKELNSKKSQIREETKI